MLYSMSLLGTAHSSSFAFFCAATKFHVGHVALSKIGYPRILWLMNHHALEYLMAIL